MGNIGNTDTQDVMNKSKTNFLFSTLFLSREKKEGLKTIYAFCRRTDDIVDDEYSSVDEKKIKLNEWTQELKKAFDSASENALLKDLNIVKEKFDIPDEPFFDLIKGMELDLVNKRYKSFEELYQYCYYAASTVGLMSIRIFGYSDENTIDYAINLGVALQLTNILRDIKKDAAIGRIYLPLDDLHGFNYSVENLMDNLYNDNFKLLMKYEVERAKKYYEKANRCLPEKDKNNMFSAIIMGKTYYEILKKIEKKNFDVYSDLIHISSFKKIFIAFLVYLNYKLFK